MDEYYNRYVFKVGFSDREDDKKSFFNEIEKEFDIYSEKFSKIDDLTIKLENSQKRLVPHIKVGFGNLNDEQKFRLSVEFSCNGAPYFDILKTLTNVNKVKEVAKNVRGQIFKICTKQPNNVTSFFTSGNDIRIRIPIPENITQLNDIEFFEILDFLKDQEKNGYKL